jgi:hypothetical protein
VDLEFQIIVRRPSEVINRLSPPQQWEVTRRHPYYLLFWEWASAVNEGESEADQLLRQAAHLILMAINFVGPPQPPSKSAADLGITAQSGAYREGAVSRVTLRSLVAILVSPLFPSETKRTIADLLSQSCDIDAGTPSETAYALIRNVSQGAHPHFDDWLPELIVAINPQAPGRAAASAVEQIIRSYKEEREIPEQRRREDKIDDYLTIWDLREGWTNGGYEVEREMRLKEIGRELKLPISTVENRYRAAFRQIVGHDYSAALWDRVMGSPKLCGLFGALPRASMMRPRLNRRQHEVPASALDRSDPAEGRLVSILEARCPAFGNLEQLELMSDIRDLIDLGRTNEQIVQELELQSSQAFDLIEYVRGRQDERQ